MWNQSLFYGEKKDEKYFSPVGVLLVSYAFFFQVSKEFFDISFKKEFERSVAGIFQYGCGGKFVASLERVLSFPVSPLWEGTHRKLIFLVQRIVVIFFLVFCM